MSTNATLQRLRPRDLVRPVRYVVRVHRFEISKLTVDRISVEFGVILLIVIAFGPFLEMFRQRNIT